ncbi:MAG: LysR family transcriptional regulator [Clostridiales bacterium]|nr:LysR family transcriptional regulator [Clostridiales bacterium]
MEIRNITTFIKIVEYNNFTKAAESLGYSQAAVTAQIKSLEAELGLPLFDRIGRSIALTEEGKTFLPYALDILHAEEAARDSVRPAEKLVGSLHICSPSSFATGPLPDILRKFHELHPQVDVTVKISDYLEDNLLKLTRAEIDFLVILDEPNAYPGFRLFAERPEPIIFVTHPSNPLCKKRAPKVTDLIGNDFIMCDRGIGYSAILEKKILSRGLTVTPSMDIGSVESIIKILLGGFGISFIPEYTVAGHLEQGELVQIRSKDVDIEFQSGLLCNSSRYINPIMKEFIRIAECRP